MKNTIPTSTYIKSNLIVLIWAIALMLLTFSKSNAQDATLTVVTETHTSGKAFKGYMITVYQDLLNNGDFTPIDQYMANSNKQKFTFKYGTAYMLDFATPSDLHYTVQFDTKTATANTAKARKFEIDVDFDKLDVNEYPNTIETVSFNDKSQDFAFTTPADNKIQQAAVK